MGNGPGSTISLAKTNNRAGGSNAGCLGCLGGQGGGPDGSNCLALTNNSAGGLDAGCLGGGRGGLGGSGTTSCLGGAGGGINIAGRGIPGSRRRRRRHKRWPRCRRRRHKRWARCRRRRHKRWACCFRRHLGLQLCQNVPLVFNLPLQSNTSSLDDFFIIGIRPISLASLDHRTKEIVRHLYKR